MDRKDEYPRTSKYLRLDETCDCDNTSEVIKLADNIYMFPYHKIGNHDNVFEGEIRSSVYDARPCVIKFAEISDQNVREAEILTKLGSHTNVIAIIQSGIYSDLFEERVYIALDKCHNENLRQYLANRKAAGVEFDLNQAIDFAKQIIAGVMYIHDNNVIHLDLKPSNVLISQNLRLIKIADFGLSIVVKSPKSKIFHKRQFGTNGYRPIESFGNGEVSMRTDIFSLGTVLLHLLSNGNNVFGIDEHTFIDNVMNDVTNTSGLLVCNPVTTEHLIKCMVSKERCRRPNIWEVSDHPCWTGKEVECSFEYCVDDEVVDIASDKVDVEMRNEIASTSDIERKRKFLARMREMGFDRKSTIVVFDDESEHLHRFDIANKSMIQMHKYSTYCSFEAVSCGEYIYMCNIDRSRLPPDERSFCRLEYCDVTAKWERMRGFDWNYEERGIPRVASSSDAIFLVGGWRIRSVSMYTPSLNQWKKLPDRRLSTYIPAVVCSDRFLYCIGGIGKNERPTSVVERFDLASLEWTRMADTYGQIEFPVAVECRQHIYVVGETTTSNFKTLAIQKYDPNANEWSPLEPVNNNVGTHAIHSAFVINGDLYFVDENHILKYEVIGNVLSIIAAYPNMLFQHAVEVKMSA